MRDIHNQNVCRPDGYNSAEKLISWAGFGWATFAQYVFIGLCIWAGISGNACLTYVVYHPLQVWFEIPYEEILSQYARWMNEAGPLFMVPLVILTGMGIGRLGRFATILILLTLSLCLFALVWKGANPSMTVAGFVLHQFWLFPSIALIAYIYCYEITPIKWRVPVMFGMSLVEPFGSLLIALANTLSLEDSSVVEVRPENFDNTYYFDQALETAKGDARLRYCCIFVMATLGTALLASLLVRTDTCISLICRGRVGEAFDYLFKHGTEKTNAMDHAPLPMTKEEFRYNEIREESSSSMDFVIILQIFLFPIGLVCLATFAIVVVQDAVAGLYYYQMEDYLGEGFSHNMVPGMLAEFGAKTVGVVLAICMWLRLKDIRFIPAVGAIFAGIGALICSTVPNMHPNGSEMRYSELSSPDTVVLGMVIMHVGLPVLKSCVNILVMDLFCNKSRGQGVMRFKAIELISYAGCYTMTEHAKTQPWFFALCAAVIVSVGVLLLAAFYMTNWFEHSLLCRDPEVDACWLVSEKGSSLQNNYFDQTVSGHWPC